MNATHILLLGFTRQQLNFLIGAAKPLNPGNLVDLLLSHAETTAWEAKA